MKRIIVFFALLLGVAHAQKINTTANKVTVKDSLKLGTKWVKAITVDTTLSTIADNTLPTTRVVKKYVDAKAATKLSLADTVTLSNRINSKQNALTAGANISIVGNTISSTGGGAVDDPTIAQLGFVANMAGLKASTLYTAGGTSTIKQIKLLGWWSNNDGGGGDFVWNPNGTAIDEGVNIKPTSVSGAGRWERVISVNYVDARWFGAVDDYKQISNVKVDVANSRIYQEHVVSTPVSLVHSPLSFSAVQIRNGSGTIAIQFTPLTWPGDYNNRLAFLAYYTSRTDLYFESGGVAYPLATLSLYGGAGGGWDGNYISLISSNASALLALVPSNGNIATGTLVTRDLATTPLDGSISVGKNLVVEGSRLWSAYKAEPIDLNIKITNISGNYAYFTNFDASRGVAYATANPNGENAVLFTEATGAITNALAYQASNEYSHVQLGNKITCIEPYTSSIWSSLPTYDNGKSVFNFANKNGLQGNLYVEGRTDADIGYGYAYLTAPTSPPGSPTVGQIYQEGTDADGIAWKWTGSAWEVQRWTSNYAYKTTLFYFTPTANAKSLIQLKNLNITLPATTEVQSGYRLFQDWTNAVIRHGMEVLIDNVHVSCPSYNVQVLESNGGGVYGINNKIEMPAGYTITNSSFDGVGAVFNYKSVDDLTSANMGGKYLKIKDSKFDGGTYNAFRQFNEATHFSKTGSGASSVYYLDVDNVGFTWYDYNAHSKYSFADNTVLKPYCRIRKCFKFNVTAAVKNSNGSISITMSASAPAGSTNAHGECLVAFGTAYQVASWYTGLGSETQFGTEITAGSNIVVAWGMHDLSAERVAAMVGKEIRVYYKWDDVKVADIITPKRVRLRLNATENTIDGEGMDVIINYSSGATMNNYGHFVYGSSNITYDWENVRIKNAAKLAMRISPESSAGVNHSYFKNVQFEPVQGPKSLPTMTNNWTPYFQLFIPVDFVNCSEVKNDNIVTGGLIDNTKISGSVAGNITLRNSELSLTGFGFGKTFIDNCTGSIMMGSAVNDINVDFPAPDVDIKNSNLLITWKNGTFNSVNSALSVGQGLSNLDTFNTAIKRLNAKVTGGSVTTIENPGLGVGSFTGFSTDQKAQWAKAIQYENVGASPAKRVPAGYAYKKNYLSFGDAAFKDIVVENSASIGIGDVVYPRLGKNVVYNGINTYSNPADGLWIFYIDSRYNYYEVQSTSQHVDGFRISHYIHDANADYITAAQEIYKSGIRIKIKNITAGTVYYSQRIKTNTKRPRDAGELLYFTYDGTDWIEDYKELFASAAPSYTGVTGEFVRNSTTSAVLGWSYNGTSWVVINR